MDKIFIAGGAGFIGSTLAKRLLKEKNPNIHITIYDNFKSGSMAHLDKVKNDQRLNIIEGDIKELKRLSHAMVNSKEVWHFASNADISLATQCPDIDFWEGTALTNYILEAMRINGVKKLIYASGSGVYGDTGYEETGENYSPMRPISTYGASKIAGEALICSYCHMFNMTAIAYRFANVVGPRQTHGVGYDFIRNLKKDPNVLRILGDGLQSKSYIYVDDVLDAIYSSIPYAKKPFDIFNIATGDYITVKEIAELAIEVSNLNTSTVKIEFAGGDRGWKGDVPIVRFNLQKIHNTGWKAKYKSRDALRKSMLAMKEEI